MLIFTTCLKIIEIEWDVQHIHPCTRNYTSNLFQPVPLFFLQRSVSFVIYSFAELSVGSSFLHKASPACRLPFFLVPSPLSLFPFVSSTLPFIVVFHLSLASSSSHIRTMCTYTYICIYIGLFNGKRGGWGCRVGSWMTATTENPRCVANWCARRNPTIAYCLTYIFIVPFASFAFKECIRAILFHVTFRQNNKRIID